MMNPKHKRFLVKYGSVEHLDKLVNDEDIYARIAVASNPNATKDHLDKLVNDKDWQVRWALARHPNATKEHLGKLVNDEDRDVSKSATKAINYLRAKDS